MLWLLLAATLSLKTPQVRAAAVAGSASKDCGWVRLGRDAWPTINCTAGHFKRGKPFYAWFQQQGIDSMVADGIAMNGKGEVFRLRYDSMGGWFGSSRCASAALARVGAREYVKCGSEDYLPPNVQRRPLRVGGDVKAPIAVVQ